MNLTTAEKRLKILLKIFTIAFLIAVLFYELGPLIGPFKDKKRFEKLLKI